jgi:hypothetical protein
MKIRKYKPEETLGLVVGVILFFIVMVFIIEAGILLNISNQIVIWVTIGLAALMITIGHYIASRKVIDEKTRTEDIIAIKGNLIGYFLWLIVIIIANLLKIEITPVIIIAGGYATILLVLVYMNKRFPLQKKYERDSLK